eukprot:TRINITY_DN10516_c0_g1_i1.p1 TRINITY_DN10516_c0_g1~~TRINITY_DN10516_c0_g1_i1.p1  ORF type:complete len:359 (-),score=71.68 TRINITY_DN10516_c0_g1_i1:152-1228(-)
MSRSFLSLCFLTVLLSLPSAVWNTQIRSGELVIANCTEQASQLLSDLYTRKTIDLFYDYQKFTSLVKGVFNESCLVSPRNFVYCNATQATVNTIVQLLLSSAPGSFYDFDNLFPAVSLNLFNWTTYCAFLNPLPVRPNPIPWLRNGSLYCNTKISAVLRNVTTLFFIDRNPQYLTDAHTELNYDANFGGCFNKSMSCSYMLRTLNLFFTNTQSASYLEQWNNSLIQYRENLIAYVNLCYLGNGTGPVPPGPTPNTSNSTCGDQLRNISQGLEYALNITDDYVELIKDLRGIKPLVNGFQNCVTDDTSAKHSKICKSLAQSFVQVYLETIFAPDYEEVRARVAILVDDVNDLFEVCNLW